MNVTKLTFNNEQGERLVGDLYQPENLNTESCVIHCHGFLSSRNSSKFLSLAKEVVKHGIAAYTFDFSAIGDSEGKLSDMKVSKYIEDLNSCIKMIESRFKKIALIGSSLGGLTVLNSALNQEIIKGLILWSGVANFKTERYKQMSAEAINIWKQQGNLRLENKKGMKFDIPFDFYLDGMNYTSYNRYARISTKALIIHGTNDASVDLEQAKILHSKLKNSELLIIDGMDHYYSRPSDMLRVTEESVRFLKDVLK